MKQKILVTGGAGYIGSHTILELLGAGQEVMAVDNLANSHREAINRVSKLSNSPLKFTVGDIRNTQFLDDVFSQFAPDVVIHFAGRKSVKESFEKPLEYYDSNVSGSRSLLQAMSSANCHKIIFSSSAAVYGAPVYLPLDESHPTNPLNPYGRTKLMVEQIITDWCASDSDRSAISLRYFNPIGAHTSGLIGEAPNGKPNNLMPHIAQVAIGMAPFLRVFGDDHDTRDGTGERDYIHVVDLARAHALSLEHLASVIGHEIINAGTGTGVTVLELVSAFEHASGKKIPKSIVDKRVGDTASSYADANRARELLGWEPEFDLEAMCRDAWVWQDGNKFGYG